MFDQLQMSLVLSKIDCHQLNIREEDIPKTAIRIWYCSYLLLVLSLELSIALANFIDLMNRVFVDYLDKFVIVFINDILVYSKAKEHEEH